MKLTALRPLALLPWLLLASRVQADEAPRPEDLVARLGSDTFADREKASQELWKLGEGGLDLLKQAAASDDPEVARRAKELIRKIDLGILPDSSPAIIELVMAYDKAAPAERLRILRSLKGQHAYRQTLKLYATEKEESAIALLGPEIKGVALDAARECLASDPPNPAGAIAYLKIGLPGPAEWMAIASIHRSMGTLEQEMKSAEADTSAQGPLRRYTLLAVEGRVKEAAKAAEQANLPFAAWRMHALDGNPLPWIQGAAMGDDDSPPEGLADYREWVTRQWTSGQITELKYQPRFLALANSTDEEKAATGVAFLTLTRDYASAEKQLVKESPLSAFKFFAKSERIDEALTALGLDPAAPDYKKWIDEHFEAVITKPEDNEVPRGQLLELGRFMAEQGMKKELEEFYQPGLQKMLDDDAAEFLQFCAELLQSEEDAAGNELDNLCGPIFRLIPKHAGEDDSLWEGAIQSVFGQHSNVLPLWQWLKDLDPALDRGQRLERSVLLLGVKAGRESDFRGFLDKAWDSFQKSNAADQAVRIQLLTVIAMRSGDPADFYKVAQAQLAGSFVRDMAKENLVLYARLYLGVMGTWDKCAEEWKQQVQKTPNEAPAHAYLAASLARVGDVAGSTREEAIASRLALADAATEQECSSAFASAGEMDRAGRWQRQAMLDYSPDLQGFYLIEKASQDAMDRQDWKLAASLGEILSFQVALKSPSLDDAALVMKYRVDADMARAFSRLKEEPQPAMELLKSVLSSKSNAGAMADNFYPGLRAAGLIKEHDEWFEQSWKDFQPLMQRYPDADNMLNSMAWACSRANRHLDEAEAMLKHSLELRPMETNYLDTMAEIWFCRRNREKAVEWSTRTLRMNPLSPVMLQRLDHFKSAEFPPP